jgi:anaerobic selenocysteine-containing dehydrogenase
LESTQAVLALNAQAASLGKQGNMFLSPATLVKPEIAQLPNSIMEVNELIRRMHDGKVKALFIHGFNPLFELPGGMEIKAGLDNVSQIFSFSSFMDETALQSDYIFPDHTGLESWGYQKVHTADRIVISGYQPTVVPFYSTKATTDVLLASVQAIGGSLASALPYKDEVEYIQNSLANLVGQSGAFNAPEIKTFMSLFQQNGGWWNAQPALQTPDITGALNQLAAVPMPDFLTHYDYYLIPFMSPILGDGSGANRPWLQETPDPTTTVMWNSWVEINPQTADLLGLENDDLVKLISEEGEIEVAVYRYPGIRPDTFGIPFGQGHTAFGRYASSRGVNPFSLLSLAINGADDLAFGSTKVYLQKTGRKQPLSRLESRMGVYGEGIGE